MMSLNCGVMQPYFFPYIGYFQLMNAVDEFVIYDNIEYTKKGWINRNRILVNGKDENFTLTLKKDSDYLKINERILSNNWHNDRLKMLNKIKESYWKAPFFNSVFPVVEKCLFYEDENLFKFLFNSINEIKNTLGIKTKLSISSEISNNHELKSEEKVISISKSLGANTYINPIGGLELYNKSAFSDRGLNLQFLRALPFEYQQFKHSFVPWLSIIDVMMFLDNEKILIQIKNGFELI